MLANIDFEYRTVVFGEINLIPLAISNIPEIKYCCLPYNPDRNCGVLTRDGALLLLKLHPLVLWDNNCCVLGRRVLHLVAQSLKNEDEISVFYLPKARKDQVVTLMSLEPLLTQIVFATQAGGKGIFETSRLMNKQLVSSVCPPLTQSVETVSKMLGDCSLSTLFKLNAHFI